MFDLLQAYLKNLLKDWEKFFLPTLGKWTIHFVSFSAHITVKLPNQQLIKQNQNV